MAQANDHYCVICDNWVPGFEHGGNYKVVWSKEKKKREFINYFETLPAGQFEISPCITTYEDQGGWNIRQKEN
jgi:hypothetical protein